MKYLVRTENVNTVVNTIEEAISFFDNDAAHAITLANNVTLGAMVTAMHLLLTKKVIPVDKYYLVSYCEAGENNIAVPRSIYTDTQEDAEIWAETARRRAISGVVKIYTREG